MNTLAERDLPRVRAHHVCPSPVPALRVAGTGHRQGAAPAELGVRFDSRPCVTENTAELQLVCAVVASK